MNQIPISVSTPPPEGSVRRAASRNGPEGLDENEWKGAECLLLSRYWSGETAPAERRCEARLLWSDAGLHIRFKAEQWEPPVVAEHPVLDRKTIGLWDRDVCEIFIAPGRETSNRYFEFEVAPTGEWLDLAIKMEGTERVTEWGFRSEMKAMGRISEDSVEMAIAVPWTAFGVRPEIGDVWCGNLFRTVGFGKDRGYLAWSPTFTERPDFHVPERFGKLVFG